MEHAQAPGISVTSICSIDAETGNLSYRGYDIAELASECCFEETAYLLWHGELPDSVQLRETIHALAAHRELPLPVMGLLAGMPRQARPMAVLRTAVSLLGAHDPRADDELEQTNLQLARELTARMATLTAAWHHLRQREDPVPADPGLGHAANFLYCLTGEYPDEVAARAFDSCLTLHAEHGFNPSTLAARFTAATLSDMYSAVAAGIGALRGPLHGGANQQVVPMLQEIGRPEDARDWVLARLREGRRIMGFGHPVYCGEDPRAAVLRDWCHKLAQHVGQPEWYEVSLAVEEVVLAEQGLHPNVDFFSASVYTMLGIEPELFNCVFAMARVAGWTAHILEQWRQPRPMRPLAVYIGPPQRSIVPLQDR